MARTNVSSIDMASGKKCAYFASQQQATQTKFQSRYGKTVDQVINAKKGEHLNDAKAKAKRKAKLAKASRKKNKK